MNKQTHYPSQVFWSEEDQAFIALAPDLPGCSAFGETEAKAIKELRVAVELWLEAARSMNRPIPAPSKLPEPNGYSGKVLLRIPRSLHERLAKQADVEGVSLNSWMMARLAESSAAPKNLGANAAYQAMLHSAKSEQNDYWLLMQPANRPVVSSAAFGRSFFPATEFTVGHEVVVTSWFDLSSNYSSVNELKSVRVIGSSSSIFPKNLEEIENG